jgi:hypothetical protein
VHDKIIKFIDLIRGPYVEADDTLTEQDTSAGIITEVFTRGNCGNFAQALQLAFGGKVLYVEETYHLVCEIEGRLYDITGDVTDKYWHMYVITPSTTQLEDNTNNYSFEARGPLD